MTFTVVPLGDVAFAAKAAAKFAGAALGRCLMVCGILSPQVMKGSMVYSYGEIVEALGVTNCH